MMESIDKANGWRWAAFGKHPASKEYFRLGEETPFVAGFFDWMENGFQLLTSRDSGSKDFCSWRFWARDTGKNTLICGVVRASSDSVGRSYPLAILGSGNLDGWQDHWDLVPFSAERTWSQIEYIASSQFEDFRKLEKEIGAIRVPDANWTALEQKRKALNRLGSDIDPYASFLDLKELKKTAAANSKKADLLISLDRGPCNDKIMHVSLWHLLYREAAAPPPKILFMGGTLDQAYLSILNRSLNPEDFIQLWTIASAGPADNMISAQYSKDLSMLGKQAVNAENPCGSDIRYDPAFDELQTEVDKLTSPAIAGTVNWEKICRFSADILTNKSKDLLVASYLAVALVHTRRNDGFAVGLKIYQDLLERFWDDLYPNKVRMRGRTRAVEWWLEKTEMALKQVEGLSFSAEQSVVIKDGLNKLDSFLNEHMENSPSLSPVKELVNDLSDGDSAPAEARKTVSAPVVEKKPEPPLSAPKTARYEGEEAGLAGKISSQQDAVKALNSGLQRINEATYFLWQQDLANPQTYRLARTTAWYAANELPPAVNGQTKIPPPGIQLKNMLLDIRNNGDSESLLKASEARLSEYIFWLDLNRLSAEALSRLGSRFEKAHDAVCEETALLLHRLPGLQNLSFSDGTPFATPDTKQWLKTIAFEGKEAAGRALEGAAPDDSVEAAIEREMGEIQNLVRKGKLMESMEAVQLKLRGCLSQREKMMWRLALSQTLLNAKKPRLALPHLEQILRDIDKYWLDEFDPALAMRGYKLAWLAFDHQTEQRFKDRAVDVLHQIGRLDISEMILLSKG